MIVSLRFIQKQKRRAEKLFRIGSFSNVSNDKHDTLKRPEKTILSYRVKTKDLLLFKAFLLLIYLYVQRMPINQNFDPTKKSQFNIQTL
jgi:hypothetical protein